MSYLSAVTGFRGNPSSFRVKFTRRWYRLMRSISKKTLLPAMTALYLRGLMNRLFSFGSDRVLMLCGPLTIGGVERVNLTIIQDLRQKYAFSILTCLGQDQPWESEFRKVSRDLVHLDRISPSIAHCRLIESYARGLKPSRIIISNALAGYESIIEIKKSLPEAQAFDILHTYGTPAENDSYLRLSMPFDKFLDRRVTISDHLKEYYVGHYPVDPKKIIVVRNGVTPVRVSKEEISFLRKQLELTEDDFVITFASRLEPDKSPLRLVEIADALIHGHDLSQLRVVVAGDGSLRKDMEEEVRKRSLEDIFRFVGFRENISTYFALSNASILTSDREGMPMSILESMSVGTPAIAPRVGGIPEIIIDEKDGFLVAQKQAIVEEYAKTIIRAVKKLKNGSSTREAARIKVEQEFSHMTRQYDEVLRG